MTAQVPKTKWHTNVPRAFSLVLHAARKEALVIMAIMLVQALIPAASAWVAKHIVDGVVNAINTRMDPAAGFGSVLPWLLTELALITVSRCLSQAAVLINHVIDNRVHYHVQTLVIGKANSLELSFFEDSTFYDMLQNASN